MLIFIINLQEVVMMPGKTSIIVIRLCISFMNAAVPVENILLLGISVLKPINVKWRE